MRVDLGVKEPKYVIDLAKASGRSIFRVGISDVDAGAQRRRANNDLNFEELVADVLNEIDLVRITRIIGRDRTHLYKADPLLDDLGKHVDSLFGITGDEAAI